MYETMLRAHFPNHAVVYKNNTKDITALKLWRKNTLKCITGNILDPLREEIHATMTKLGISLAPFPGRFLLHDILAWAWKKKLVLRWVPTRKTKVKCHVPADLPCQIHNPGMTAKKKTGQVEVSDEWPLLSSAGKSELNLGDTVPRDTLICAQPWATLGKPIFMAAIPHHHPL